jgi:predicted ATPase
MDRITRLYIDNVRAIESLTLDLSPLTVLIGDNGAGKSTILECLAILRKATESSFIDQLYQVHGGLPSLLRKGTTSLRLGVDIENSDLNHPLPPLHYSFELLSRGSTVWVSKERLDVSANASKPPLTALRRGPSGGTIFDQSSGQSIRVDEALLDPESLLITAYGRLPPQIAISRLLHVLRSVEVHLPFYTCAAWAARAVQLPLHMRGSATLFPAKQLNLLGLNLANAWTELKNLDSAHWDHTLGLVRLGIGDWVDTVLVKPDAGGGSVSLLLKGVDWDEPIAAASLSDGQLAWLSFVAMTRLHQDRSLLAMDEPELHLHPHLLGRAVELMVSAGRERGAPVVLCTHSDRVLELIDDPVSALRVCSLEGGRVLLSRLSAEALPRWLERFGDVGALRGSGYLSKALVPVTPALGGAEPPA